MMFSSLFHDGILSGHITRTYRYWRRPQAKVGGLQRVARAGFIEVLAVDIVEPGTIKSKDAAMCGFSSLAELKAYLQHFDDGARDLYQIDFRFVGDRPDREPDRRPVFDASEIAGIDKALDLRDRNSKAGPWTRDTLKLVGAHPGMPSAQMAKILGREQVALKQDMRKLKKLGLTTSLEAGYKLSPRGESYLKRR